MNGRPIAALVVLNLAVHCGGPFGAGQGPAADAGADVEQLDHVAGDVAVEVLEEAPHDALAGDVAGDELEQHDAGADVGLVDALEAGCGPSRRRRRAGGAGQTPVPGQYCANVTTQAGTSNEPAAMPAACACSYWCACLLCTSTPARRARRRRQSPTARLKGGALTVTCPSIPVRPSPEPDQSR